MGRTFNDSRMQHFVATKVGGRMIRVSIIMFSTLLAGCAQWPIPTSDQAGEAVGRSVESVSFGRLLDHEPADTLVTLSSSPWGSNVRVLLHETYAAASGRNCRRLTVEPEGQAYPALTCRVSDKAQEWVPVRLLQIGGRPVLSPDTSLPAWKERR